MNVWLYLEDGPDSRTLSIPVPRELFGAVPPETLTLRDGLSDEKIVLRYQATTIVNAQASAPHS